MLPVPEHHAAHVPDAGAVHQNPPGLDGAPQVGGLFPQLDDPADIRDQDILALDPHLLGQLGMAPEMLLLPVHGDEVPGLHQGQDHLLLLLAGMTGNMKAGAHIPIHHLRALPEEFVHDGADALFIPRNGGGGKDHPIPVADLHLLMAAEGHAVQGGHAFPLAPGGKDELLLFGIILDPADLHQGVRRQLDIPQLHGGRHHVFHAAAGDGNLSPMLRRQRDDLLHPVYVGCEGGNDHTLGAAVEKAVQRSADGALRG